ncbi:DUF2183 domain-containing protein [Algoriphagus marincola]|uniref:DUF2183 domain-containing protein n=1 Tax=Algoriphagus marincola TaxID=264027 RepID=A0ABS7MZ60_9BACT|nr:phosphatase domain-containing protein [Algoriphagus marincola]MBY5949353.1 DUF2183 domain-containing protein [Algoriphagus marincola]
MPFKKLLPLLYFFKRQVSNAKLWMSIRLGLVKKAKIQPYLGFGSEREIYLAGRVLEDKGIAPANEEDGFKENFRSMRKRFLTVIFPGVDVRLVWGEERLLAKTDEEGYFEFRFSPKKKPESGWNSLSLSLPNPPIRNQGQVEASAWTYVPSKKADFGIISDIDDTIVPTGATRLWDMLKTTFAKNAHTRIPFAGVAALYDALRKGSDGEDSNPIFYVSSSPWNLYDFLQEMMAVHQIPRGPLMLRDLGLSRDQFIAGSHWDHKLKQAKHILSTYPELPFILIGDSGQKDPEIYLEVCRDFPGRIQGVYIRAVGDRDLSGLQEDYEKLAVSFILMKDSLDASRHAAGMGWILEEDQSTILRQKLQDEAG